MGALPCAPAGWKPALREGVEEEVAEAAASGDVEWWKFDGVVAAGEKEFFVGNAVGVKGVEELLRIFRPKGGVVAGGDEEGALFGSAVNVGKGADG